MKLYDVLKGVQTYIRIEDLPDFDVRDIENDSRNAGKNTLFVASSSYVEDAHQYIESAYKNGCRYFVIGGEKQDELKNRFPSAFFIPVKLVKDALFRVSKNYFGDPSERLKMVGITGTSGKTTTAFAIYSALMKMGKKAGLIGTIEYRILNQIIPATNTTPDILYLNRILAQMVEKGVEYLVMEVSSHSLSLGRVAGLNFDIVAFTNFSQDHLDFHKTMEEYLLAKMHIFDLLAESGKSRKVALVNRETPRFDEIKNYSIELIGFEFKTFSTADKGADYWTSVKDMTPEYSEFELARHIFKIGMIGWTNIYNFTLAAAVLLELGFKPDDFRKVFDEIRVNGRMESVPNKKNITVIIDYAHKPDAIKKVLETVRDVIKNGGNLIIVFGAGGDRDKTKRPIMGEIAGSLADRIIVTSDNPRTEDPLTIMKDIEEGIKESGNKNYILEENRQKAIHKALSEAKKGDAVIIAGKGHEDYQIIGKTKRHFSDREEVISFFNKNI